MSKRARQLAIRLGKIGKRVADEVEEALVKSAGGIVGLQRARAPSEDGTLRGTIGHTPARRTKRNISVTISAGGEGTTRPVMNGQSGSYDYAVGQEFGTAKMSANPFFYPPIREKESDVRGAVRAAFRKGAKL